jgi:hypothetical protein
MNMFPIIFGALTFVSTLAGGLFAVRYRKRFGILAAFAAGSEGSLDKAGFEKKDARKE